MFPPALRTVIPLWQILVLNPLFLTVLAVSVSFSLSAVGVLLCFLSVTSLPNKHKAFFYTLSTPRVADIAS